MRREQPFGGIKLIKPVVHSDDRGYFFESWKKNASLWIDTSNDFVQDNESQSQFGVIRGLHYQKTPFAQAKLVRVIMGQVFDVAVDIRPHSETYGDWYGVHLTSDNKWQLYIPEGFAHGFAALSNSTILAYKCNQYYHAASEGSIHPLDKTLAIDWPLSEEAILLSPKDASAPNFNQHFPFL
jgi:dTDP-4-dehydrorhamnose 3,5-epimerase